MRVDVDVGGLHTVSTSVSIFALASTYTAAQAFYTGTVVVNFPIATFVPIPPSELPNPVNFADMLGDNGAANVNPTLGYGTVSMQLALCFHGDKCLFDVLGADGCWVQTPANNVWSGDRLRMPGKKGAKRVLTVHTVLRTARSPNAEWVVFSAGSLGAPDIPTAPLWLSPPHCLIDPATGVHVPAAKMRGRPGVTSDRKDGSSFMFNFLCVRPPGHQGWFETVLCNGAPVRIRFAA
jgi:hypothetical protein